MAGKPGIRNLIGMRGRTKGGQSAPITASLTPDSLASCSAAFLTHLATRAYSAQSIHSHRWALKGFVDWAETRGLSSPASFTRARIEEFQHHLHHYRSPRGGRALVINTQLARLGCVRRFFAWLCRSGVLPANPAADLDLPRKQSRQLPKSLSVEEIDRILSIPNPADPFGLRDRTILELFYATGIRRTEMTNLDHGDYDPSSGTLLVRKGKGGKSRMLPVGERAAAWLDRFLAESRQLFNHEPGQTAMFLSGYGTRITSAYLGNWVKSLMKRCGIDKLGSCHLFRHSCATHMHRGGADIRYVQDMLGHERLETTQIYTHVHIDALREVHTRTHPHGRLDANHDLYGRIGNLSESIPESVETELPSPEPGKAVIGGSMVMAAPRIGSPETRPSGAGRADPELPPNEDPPAGGAPVSGSKPGPAGVPGGAALANLASTDTQKPSISQGTGMEVTDYGYRYYHPQLGRWLSRDPIEEMGGMNLYGFNSNWPTDRFDFLGREPLNFDGQNGGFRVNPVTVDDAINPNMENNVRNIPFRVAGYDADYFPDADETCPNMKLIQVISYAGSGDNFGPELDNNGKDKRKSPGYRESGGAASRSGHPGGIFDAPINDTVFDKHDRPLGKGTYYLEICAVCCPDTDKERILGCVRFDFDSPTGRITPGVGGAERTPEGGFTAPALRNPTRHYRDGRWR